MTKSNYSWFQFTFETWLWNSHCKVPKFEVHSNDLQWFNSKQFDWLAYFTGQLQLTKFDHRKSLEQILKQNSELYKNIRNLQTFEVRFQKQIDIKSNKTFT
jgi:myo-inositol catabolism protein IolC